MTPTMFAFFIAWGYLVVFDGTGKIEEHYDKKYYQNEAKFKKQKEIYR